MTFSDLYINITDKKFHSRCLMTLFSLFERCPDNIEKRMKERKKENRTLSRGYKTYKEIPL